VRARQRHPAWMLLPVRSGGDRPLPSGDGVVGRSRSARCRAVPTLAPAPTIRRVVDRRGRGGLCACACSGATASSAPGAGRSPRRSITSSPRAGRRDDPGNLPCRTTSAHHPIALGDGGGLSRTPRASPAGRATELLCLPCRLERRTTLQADSRLPPGQLAAPRKPRQAAVAHDPLDDVTAPLGVPEITPAFPTSARPVRPIRLSRVKKGPVWRHLEQVPCFRC
jgi:hypothetical protein